MNRIARLLGIALIGVAALATPAAAQHRHYHGGGGGGAVVGGLAIGLLTGAVIGAAVASPSPPPTVVYAAPPPPTVVYAAPPPPPVAYVAPMGYIYAPNQPVPPQQTTVMVPGYGAQTVTVEMAPTAYPSQPSCRPYSTTIVANGQYQPVSGTACQNPDGTWRLVS